jgi:hypothetical protein
MFGIVSAYSCLVLSERASGRIRQCSVLWTHLRWEHLRSDAERHACVCVSVPGSVSLAAMALRVAQTAQRRAMDSQADCPFAQGARAAVR